VNMTINPVLATVTSGFIPADSRSGDSSVPAAMPNAPAPTPGCVWCVSHLVLPESCRQHSASAFRHSPRPMRGALFRVVMSSSPCTVLSMHRPTQAYP